MFRKILIICSILIFGYLNVNGDKLQLKLVFKEKNDPKYSLSSAAYLFLDKEANIYLLASDSTIKKYSKDGVFINQFAKKGQGPGEITFCCGANIIKDNIYILDLFRKHIFSTSGKILKTETRPKTLYTARDAKFINENSWIMIGDSIMEQDVPGILELFFCEENGKKMKKLTWIGCPELNSYKNIRSYDGTYLKDIVMDVSTGDIIYAKSDEYKIWKYNQNKSILLISENPVPEKVSDKIKNWAKAQQKTKFAVVLPENMNLITSIQFDQNGNIWVMTYSKDFKGLKKYNKAGKFLESYPLDIKYDYDRTNMKIAANFIFFSIYDENEGQKIYRASIPK